MRACVRGVSVPSHRRQDSQRSKLSAGYVPPPPPMPPPVTAKKTSLSLDEQARLPVLRYTALTACVHTSPQHKNTTHVPHRHRSRHNMPNTPTHTHLLDIQSISTSLYVGNHICETERHTHTRIHTCEYVYYVVPSLYTSQQIAIHT